VKFVRMHISSQSPFFGEAGTTTGEAEYTYKNFSFRVPISTATIKEILELLRAEADVHMKEMAYALGVDDA